MIKSYYFNLYLYIRLYRDYYTLPYLAIFHNDTLEFHTFSPALLAITTNLEHLLGTLLFSYRIEEVYNLGALYKA